ncbi:hypothetical protein EA473_21705 [Natrarchaeobius chitinivorans]|uniref:Right handed beta helix domain-containing protein n=1 Tax=Natrarchaeobius chitinivorans TaxID=1679083 RepID=A0A3N6LLD8_NATCH|nr:hypothetical protein EA473_21705 [Natrarchaeobius chitinivorans]
MVHMTAPDLDEYVEGIVIAPHGIGNSGRQLVNLNFAKNVGVGPFEVTGRAGAKWQLTDEENHNGEIVYVGTGRTTIHQHDNITGWDRTQDIHIHHIDNSAGHPHSQLVDVKPGAENVTIEYCTDGGGSQNDLDRPATSVNLAGYDCTLRWCLIQDGEGNAVNVGREVEDSPDDEIAEQVGTENAIYGNEISGFGDGWGLGFSPGSDAGQGPEHQAIICGNNIEGRVAGNPESDCPEDVPTGEGIGHTGGDPEAIRATISEFEPPNMESPDQSSSADLLLYAATALATASMFVPYSVRRFRRRST